MNNAALRELAKAEAEHNSDRILALLAQVREQLDTNCLDVEDCVSALVRLLPSHNAQVKTAVCDLLVRAAAVQPDVGLLVVNTLNRDVCDPNPGVRCTALSTLCSIPGLQEQAAAALQTGFGDFSPSVRVAAVTGVGKVWRHSPSTIQEEGFVDQLYSMLRDTDPAVVTFALQTLNIILAAEGGVVINRAMARHFLSRLATYPEPEACFMLDYLRQAPAVTSDPDPQLRLELLNRLDPLLDSASGSLVVAAARLLARLVEGEDRLVASLATRLVPLLVGWVRRSGGRPEFQTVLLDFLLTLQEAAYLGELAGSVKQLHVRVKDSPDVARRKVELIARLATPDNCVELMNYLLNLVQRSNESALLNRAALAGAVVAAKQDETCYENLLRNLDLLVRTDRAAYFHLVLGLVPALSLKAACQAGHDKVATGLVASLLAAIYPEQASPAVIESALSLLTDFGGSLADQQGPRLLEDLWRLDRSCWRPGLYRLALATAYCLFVSQPAAMQPLLARILHTCATGPSHQLRTLARAYYHLLSSLAVETNS